MKKIVCTFAVLALVLSIIGCSWEVPEKVKVKTNAEYNFSLGSVEKDLTSDLSINKLLGNVTLPDNVKIYDYWPNKSGNDQRVLMYMAMSEIPIDLGQYFDADSLSSGLSIAPIEKDFSIPSMNINQNLGDVDLSTVNDSINNQFSLSGIVQTNINLTEYLASNSKFSTISYETGNFVVECDGAIDGTVTITSNENSRTAAFSSNKAELDISNFTFDVNSLSISFSDSPSPVVSFTAKPSATSKVKSVTGFSTNDITHNINQAVNALESVSGVESCTINEGSFTIALDIPESWSGVTAAPVVVNAKDMSASSITVNKDLTLKISNATIVFDNKPQIKVSSDIKKISATVDLGSSGSSLSMDQSFDLPESLLDIATGLTLNQCGIKGTYTNTLPAGNDITLKATSKFFGVENKTQTISRATSATAFSILSDNTTPRPVNLVKKSETPDESNNEFNKFDFKVDVTLPGGESDKITLTNVVPGETYSISLNIEPVIDWESVDINPSAITSALGAGAGSQTIDTHFNPGTIFTTIDDTLKNMVGENTFVSNLQFPECNLHLYITKPQITAFDGLSFNGSTVKMYYKAGSSKNDETVIMGTGVNENLGFANKPNIKVTKTSDGSDVVTAPITGASLDLAIADVLNNGKKEENKNATLCVDYNLQIDGVNGSAITINKSDLSNSSGSIGIYAYIDIPLKLNLSADSNIDLTNIVQQSVSGDLFGRSDASGLDEVEKFLDAFESVSVAYSTKKLPVKCGEMTFTAVFKDGSGTTVLTKDIPIGTRAGNLKIESADVRKLLNAYPLTVEPKISIPSGEFSIPREKKVDLDISLKIKTDGTIDLM